MTTYDEQQLGLQGPNSKTHNPDAAVFSAKQSFNPTNLAVKASLQEIFDELEFIVTEELRILDIENEP